MRGIVKTLLIIIETSTACEGWRWTVARMHSVRLFSLVALDGAISAN